jgi:hypothetical protein
MTGIQTHFSIYIMQWKNQNFEWYIRVDLKEETKSHNRNLFIF